MWHPVALITASHATVPLPQGRDLALPSVLSETVTCQRGHLVPFRSTTLRIFNSHWPAARSNPRARHPPASKTTALAVGQQTMTRENPAKYRTGIEPHPPHKVERGLRPAYTIARLYAVPVEDTGPNGRAGADFLVREGQLLLIPCRANRPPNRSARPCPPRQQPLRPALHRPDTTSLRHRIATPTRATCQQALPPVE